MIKRRSLYTITKYFNLVATIIAFSMIFNKNQIISKIAGILTSIFLVITILASMALKMVNIKIENELHAKQLEEITKKEN